jgi:hypothetical protein
MQSHIVSGQIEVGELQGLWCQGKPHRYIQPVCELKDQGQPADDTLGPLEAGDDGASMDGSRFHMAEDDNLRRQEADPLGPLWRAIP